MSAPHHIPTDTVRGPGIIAARSLRASARLAQARGQLDLLRDDTLQLLRAITTATPPMRSLALDSAPFGIRAELMTYGLARDGSDDEGAGCRLTARGEDALLGLTSDQGATGDPVLDELDGLHWGGDWSPTALDRGRGGTTSGPTASEVLPRMRVSFLAWLELPPRHQAETGTSWTGPPTPLAQRHVVGPVPDRTGSPPLLLTLHSTRRAAEESAAARVLGEGQSVHRVIVELHAVGLAVVDARSLPSLTNSSLLSRDVDSWDLLREIRDERAESIWINDATGAHDVIVLFADALDATVRIHDQAVHEIDSHGNARRISGEDPPQSDEPTSRFRHVTERLRRHGTDDDTGSRE